MHRAAAIIPVRRVNNPCLGCGAYHLTPAQPGINTNMARVSDAILSVLFGFIPVMFQYKKERPFRNASKFLFAFLGRSCPCDKPEPCVAAGLVFLNAYFREAVLDKLLAVHFLVCSPQELCPGCT